MIATAVYSLCAVISLVCSIQLVRMYARYRKQASRLVFWSSMAFAGFAVSNALVFADFVALPGVELATARAATACAASVTLLYGLIWETD
jgi:hypothetical protein